MSRFRTTEISDPEFERDHLRYMSVKTSNLKGRGSMCLFVPPVQNLENVPLVILLHGVYGDAWVWALKGRAHITAWEMMQKGTIAPMVIAMPSDGLWGDGSAYLKHHGLDFEKWIVEDVPAAVKENIPEVADASKMCISGLSMGGFGAMRIGFKYSNKFRAISAHSSITAIDQMSLFVEEGIAGYRSSDSRDVSVWGALRSQNRELPKFRFDCGTGDPLLEHNRKLHQKLEENGVPHTYEEFVGGHEWEYWQEHLKDSLLFFDGIVK